MDVRRALEWAKAGSPNLPKEGGTAMRSAFTTLVLLVAAITASAAAAENPKVALDAKEMPIEQAMAELGKQAGVQIICDPGLKETVTGTFQSIELEKLLDTITKINNLKWQKLYLPAQPDQKPTLEQIKARAEMIAALTGGSIIVVDPATGKQKVFVEQEPAAVSVSPDTLGRKPVYLISKPKPPAKEPPQTKQDPLARMQSLEAERMKLLAQMTPEQRVAAMQQEMLAMMQLDPATRQQMMIDQFKARNNMDPQLRDQYRDMMRETFRAMREQRLMPEWDRRRGRDRERGNEQQ